MMDDDDPVAAREAAEALRGEETNHVANGLLLRADLNPLVDFRMLALDPDGFRVVGPRIDLREAARAGTAAAGERVAGTERRGAAPGLSGVQEAARGVNGEHTANRVGACLKPPPPKSRAGRI